MMKRFVALFLAVLMVVCALTLASCKKKQYDDFEEIPDINETEEEGFVTVEVTDPSEKLENAPPEDDYGWGKIQ